MEKKNRYSQIIEAIFRKYYKEGATVVPFARPDIIDAADQLGIPLAKNPGDVVYSFRYRKALPESITAKAPERYEWIIRGAGSARYKLSLVTKAPIRPSDLLAETKILDATPGVISRYALNDEQALLAKLRYNRLIDIFTGLTCYSLQSHLRTQVPDMGQAETDEIYIGIDKRGVHYVLPVQAKGGTDKLGIVQIEQDFAMCEVKFPHLVCRSIAAQFMVDDLIALFEFQETPEGVRVTAEKHYRLVPADGLTENELENYRKRAIDE